MAGDLTFTEVARSLAAQRAADTLLRTLGGAMVAVRVPKILVAPGDAGQIGLSGAAAEDVELRHVVVRNAALNNQQERNRSRTELLVSATELADAKQVRDSAAAKEFFLSAIGVVVGQKLLRIESFSAEEFGGTPYLYRVILIE